MYCPIKTKVGQGVGTAGGGQLGARPTTLKPRGKEYLFAPTIKCQFWNLSVGYTHFGIAGLQERAHSKTQHAQKLLAARSSPRTPLGNLQRSQASCLVQRFALPPNPMNLTLAQVFRLRPRLASTMLISFRRHGLSYSFIYARRTLTLWPHCYHIGTAIKHPVPDRVKPSFVIFDIRALWRLTLSVRVPGWRQTQSGTTCFIAVPIW